MARVDLEHVYNLLGLEPTKVDALNHPYHDDHDGEEHDDHDDHDDHDHDRRDEDEEEHEHEEHGFECVAVESLVHLVNASSLEEGLEAAVPTLLLMVMSDKVCSLICCHFCRFNWFDLIRLQCFAPHQHGIDEYITSIMIKYSHGDNSLDVEELNEMLNAIMTGLSSTADEHAGHDHRREVGVDR